MLSRWTYKMDDLLAQLTTAIRKIQMTESVEEYYNFIIPKKDYTIQIQRNNASTLLVSYNYKAEKIAVFRINNDESLKSINKVSLKIIRALEVE